MSFIPHYINIHILFLFAVNPIPHGIFFPGGVGVFGGVGFHIGDSWMLWERSGRYFRYYFYLCFSHFWVTQFIPELLFLLYNPNSNIMG